MTGVITEIGKDIIINTIYDIVKFVGRKFYDDKRSRGKDIRELVKERLMKVSDETVNSLLESSVFAEYFSAPQFVDLINAYIEHKIIYDNANKSRSIKQHIRKVGVISSVDLIVHIADQIHNLYLENNVITIPEKTAIKKTVLFVINITEQLIAESLSEDNTRLLYLINSRIDFCSESIIASLDRLHDTLSRLQTHEVAKRNDEYEKIREVYYNILKDKNSVAHIYLLDKFPFEEFYVPPILRRNQSIHNSIHIIDIYGNDYSTYPISSWNNIFSRDNVVYITGGAGFGKSLFLKKIINNYKDLNIFHSDEYLVICGELKTFYPNESDTSLSVIEFLRESIRSSTLMDVSKEFIEHYLHSGRCIILLDALDEVDKSKRTALHETLIAFFKNQNPNNKICITSRDRGFIPEKNVEVLSISPLTETQIEKYVDRIIRLGRFEKNDKSLFIEQTQTLVRQGFLTSFLVLSLLINIYKAELKLPENKLELYQKCFEYIANIREREKTEKSFNWHAISPIMKDNTFIELAKLGMPNNTSINKTLIKDELTSIYKIKFNSEVDAENAIDDFLKFCSERTELYVPSTEDKFKFFHRSFYEYFYSLYIFLRCNTESEMLDELIKFDVDSEVFELTIAMLKQKAERKYQALINLIFEKTAIEFNNDKQILTVFNILILSMQVVDDIYYRNKFLELLIDQKDIICKNISNIHNLWLISEYYYHDDEASHKLFDAYKEICLYHMFERFEQLFKAADKYLDVTGENLLDDLNSDKKKERIVAQTVYRCFGTDKDFFMNVFSRTNNCREVLLTITDETIMEVYKKSPYKHYKKKTREFRDHIKRFREFDDDKQMKITTIISAGI